MSELKITLRVKHEPDEAPNVTEIQILRDRIKEWCNEFCLELEELKIG